MTRIKTQFRTEYKGSPGEINTEKSKTTPDMALSVKTLLTNYSRGIHSSVKHYDPKYFDQEIPVLQDITDAVEYKKELASQMKEVEAKIKKQKEALKQAQIDKAREEAQEKEKPPQNEPKGSTQPAKDD